jgi:oxygen-independent coproporphyrinogen-3 oxidase
VAFAQNKKTLHDYYMSVEKGELPVQRGYFLTDEDVAFRHYITDISCQGKTSFQKNHLPLLQEYSFPELRKLEEDNLVDWNEDSLMVTELGQHFIRNICRAFDLHLLRNQKKTETPVFSKAI